MEFLFFVGRTHALARAELEEVLRARFSEATLLPCTEQILLVGGISESDAQGLQTILGGTVKVATVDTQLPSDAPTKELESSCLQILHDLLGEKTKIQFGLAEIGRDTLPAVDHIRIKEALKDEGLSVRFVDGPRPGLGASVLLHQNVEECVIVRTESTVYLGHTIAVQNIDQWTVRDRQKPGFDPKHGMLPPKIARILVNLAFPAGVEGKRLLDPFCGTGTVVMEAMMMGAFGLGSDLRIEAVGQTQKNCDWLIAKYGLDAKFFAFVSDATHIEPSILGEKVNGIACEGFLGQLTPKPGAVPNIFKGLEKLYLGAFKQWARILEPGSRIAIALPRSTVKKTVYSLAPLIDRLEEHGYNIVLPAMIYDREGAITQREIFVLQYK